MSAVFLAWNTYTLSYTKAILFSQKWSSVASWSSYSTTRKILTVKLKVVFLARNVTKNFSIFCLNKNFVRIDKIDKIACLKESFTKFWFFRATLLRILSFFRWSQFLTLIIRTLFGCIISASSWGSVQAKDLCVCYFLSARKDFLALRYMLFWHQRRVNLRLRAARIARELGGLNTQYECV